MVYSNDDEFAKFCNFNNWDEYEASGKYPKKNTLVQHRKAANSIINRWIGCYNNDIIDPRFLEWVKQLEMEMVRRIHDKEKHRKAGEPQGPYTPHDYVYDHERQELRNIGIILGYRVVGAVG